ncbi:ABC-type dipeptide transport system, periplasmic component [Rubellimicrobium thermophilum DSM 16684]|uniref:ABC-type dipeptide transport system, periplasmic component n=1 Tax=Rubellimicrobium thermophilum DSM 16684 TaxID=1123069 RepID=S9QUE2_9RHOB|nr:ABC transporter substrate-binding protein [Rubellimicrobium thermophilum]EPX83258.1 ABC-type dipeptide transport system, periplasmic component [Rubellimicrobium thermophilum DSM 16684]
MRLQSCAAAAALFSGILPGALAAQFVEPTTPPEPPAFEAQGEPVFVNRDEVYVYRALDSYNEPEFVRAFVEAGLLPPIEERLPKEPLVYLAGNMPDGIGVYGDGLRHVIGGRPEGWNFWAGQAYGWGGIDIGMVECLTRTGPLFMVNPEDLQPFPNLARSWEWSEDGMSLTVNLIEGARWSDGDPFDTEDIDFYWNHIVMDPEVTPLMGASQETYGAGTTLEITGPYSFVMHFTTPFPEQVLYALAYGNFCPGPSHVLKPHHPAFGGESYEAFRQAFPPDYMNFPVMGAWVVVEHRPDDIVVLRRNPYYWKVDEAGNQLPYLNEVHYRLSTWADRDVQAVAGTGDFSNLEQAESYVEALRRSAEPDAPARLAFGPRTIGYSLYMNFSANGWGEPDARAQAIRELNRNPHFRMGVTQAIDRQRLGESLVRGPFTYPYPGGLYAGTSFYDAQSTVFYPYSPESARAHFEAAGLSDTDGNGFLNHPADVLGGADVQITLLANTDYATDRNLAEGVVAMMEAAGIRVSLNLLSGNDRDAVHAAGQWDWMVFRNAPELITVVQNTPQLAPTGPRIALNHRANAAGELDLMPFEQEMVDVVNAFIASRDPQERVELMKTYQRLYTENLYAIGLTAYPGALIINKRFANVPPGAPIFMYNWAEDNIIRERLWVPEEAQIDMELHPNTLPGAPGSPGPVALD